MAITIDKGVPLVPHRRYMGKFPFADMEVGDSFAVPYSEHARKNVDNCVRSYMKKRSTRFAVRKVLEDDQWVVRCWRTS